MGVIEKQRITALQTLLREAGIDYYIVPTADYHNSEYVSDYFKMREFLSGFTGSAGTLVVSGKEAGLWTDGRYFVQADIGERLAHQLSILHMDAEQSSGEALACLCVYLANPQAGVGLVLEDDGCHLVGLELH